MAIDWHHVRSKYQLPSRRVYFNSASFGAMSDETVEVQKACLDGWQYEGNTILDRAHEAADHLRRMFLNLLNAQDHQSAILPDVSTGMNLLAEVLIDHRKIVLFEKDFPAVTMPWIGRDFDIQWIEREGYTYDLSKVEEALQGGADVLAVSWVMYNSGLKMDLDTISDLCKKYDTLLIVDATQGLGVHALDLDRLSIDVLLCSCFKWFLAGYGTCMMTCTQSFVKQHAIKAAGQYAVIDGQQDIKDTNNHRKGIERFEMGHIKIQPVLALETSMIELSAIGWKAIHERCKGLMDLLCQQLEASGIELLTPHHRSNSIVMIESTPERVKKLDKASIACTNRGGLIRLSPYFYNHDEDIRALIQALN